MTETQVTIAEKISAILEMLGSEDPTMIQLLEKTIELEGFIADQIPVEKNPDDINVTFKKQRESKKIVKIKNLEERITANNLYALPKDRYFTEEDFREHYYHL